MADRLGPRLSPSAMDELGSVGACFLSRPYQWCPIDSDSDTVPSAPEPTPVCQPLRHMSIMQPATDEPTRTTPPSSPAAVTQRRRACRMPTNIQHAKDFVSRVYDYYNACKDKERTCEKFKINREILDKWVENIHRISERMPKVDLEEQLYKVYDNEVQRCNISGLSTQHIGNEWLRRAAEDVVLQLTNPTEFQVSDAWLRTFRRRYNIKYYKGRKHFAEMSSRGDGPGDVTGAPRRSVDSDTADQGIRVRADSGNQFGSDAPNSSPRRALTPELMASIFQTDPQKIFRGRRASVLEYRSVEQTLYQRIQKRHARGERLSNPWIREEARSIAKIAYGDEDTELCDFSDKWLYQFRKRYRVDLKPPEGPSDSAKTDDVVEVPANLPSSIVVPIPIRVTPSNEPPFKFTPLQLLEQQAAQLLRLPFISPDVVNQAAYAALLGSFPLANLTALNPLIMDMQFPLYMYNMPVIQPGNPLPSSDLGQLLLNQCIQQLMSPNLPVTNSPVADSP